MKSKKLIIFDLDGTLAESKAEMDEEMSQLMLQLLEKKQVAVISGGAFEQFEKQFLKSLNAPEKILPRLHLFPTCSTSYYNYENFWKQVYFNELPKSKKARVMQAFNQMFQEIGFKPKEIFGEILEDRGSQITFSALGQKAPYEKKKDWDPEQKKRKQMKTILEKLIPDLEVRIGGSTSIDVTEKGIDKAYGINKIEEHLKIKKAEMLFIGDALFEGGNDYPVKRTGVECIQVANPEETKQIIKKIIKESR